MGLRTYCEVGERADVGSGSRARQYRSLRATRTGTARELSKRIQVVRSSVGTEISGRSDNVLSQGDGGTKQSKNPAPARGSTSVARRNARPGDARVGRSRPIR